MPVRFTSGWARRQATANVTADITRRMLVKPLESHRSVLEDIHVLVSRTVDGRRRGAAGVSGRRRRVWYVSLSDEKLRGNLVATQSRLEARLKGSCPNRLKPADAKRAALEPLYACYRYRPAAWALSPTARVTRTLPPREVFRRRTAGAH